MSDRPDFVISSYGVLTLQDGIAKPTALEALVGGPLTAGQKDELSPDKHVTARTPPYFLYAGLYVKPTGLNRVGLRRAGFASDEVAALKAAYKVLYRSGLKLEDALQSIEQGVLTDHTRHLVSFIRSSTRGIARE